MSTPDPFNPQTPAPAALQSGPQLPAPLAGAPTGGMALEPPVLEDRQVVHHEPILTFGASGEPVEKLCKLLAHAGFANNSVVQGQNPHNVLDNTVMADVERFWASYPDGAEPDELYAGREGSVDELQGHWVGPFTWQKLYELAGAAVAPQTGS